MDEAELRSEVEGRLRARYEQTFTQMRARHADEEALDDETWLRQRIERMQRFNPRLAERMSERGQEMLAYRRQMSGPTEEHRELMIRQVADALMPILLKIRKGKDGPLTDAQFDRASMRKSQQDIAAKLKILREKAKTETDPRKRAILSLFAKNVSADLGDMKALADPNVTEEAVEGFTSKVTSRMQSLTNLIRQSKPAE